MAPACWLCHTGFEQSQAGGGIQLKRKIRFCVYYLAAFLMGEANAVAQTLQDPEGSGVIIGAVNWLQGTLLGTFATVAAVIAVASVGFMMLTGRINWRHGAVVILGCFILFGAASIVSGIRASAGG